MRILQKNGLALLLLLVFLLSMSVVSAAANRRIQVDMSEVVDMNVTYGQDFVSTGAMTETIQFCEINGTINVSNPSLATDQVPVSDVVVWVNNTDNVNNITYLSGRNGSVLFNNTGNDEFVLHVTELRPGNWTVFNYTINCSPLSGSTVNPPLNISTSYSSEFSGITNKVLAGHSWTINQTANNSLSVNQPINNINITMTAQTIDWNGSIQNFTFSGLNAQGDNDSVTEVNTSFWYWDLSGGAPLANGAQEYIVYNMTAPTNVPTSGTYLALTEKISYIINYLASDLNVVNVTGVADLDIYVGKQIIRPSDDLNNTNVTWRVDANVTVPANLSYNLTTVSLWVTSNVSPIATALPNGFGFINKTYNLNQEVNQTLPWSNSSWLFNYTDGSNGVTSPAPIVWMKPYFTIMPNYGQIYVVNTTQDGNDYYMKYIYVVNGYWLQVNKNITSIDDDTYLINTTVENIGNAWTPEGLAVTVYDFVPVNFLPKWGEGYSRTPSSMSNQAIDTAQFNGTSYMWAIPPVSPFNSSLGPNTESLANRTWNVWYYVNGTSDYKVSELYIVGLDPRKVDGAGTHEGISLISGFGSNSREAFYLLIVFFLIIINVVNFVMTRRINEKLNSHK